MLALGFIAKLSFSWKRTPSFNIFKIMKEESGGTLPRTHFLNATNTYLNFDKVNVITEDNEGGDIATTITRLTLENNHIRIVYFYTCYFSHPGQKNIHIVYGI